MGCSSSQPPPPAAANPQATQPKAQVAPAAGKGKGKGKGKAKGKGKGKGLAAQGIKKDSKFQIELSGKWEDYDKEEDAVLKRAFLVGQPNARYRIRDNDYEYQFADKMIQINKKTGKSRHIRSPWKMTAPKQALLPTGPMVVVAIPPGGAKSMEIKDPNNPGKTITVALPPRARPGSKLAVPVPAKGESVTEVVKRQNKHGKEWSTGAKVAAGAAAVGAMAVGGVVLGEHLSGGAISSWAESSPELDAAGDWVAGAAGDVADWAGGAAEWAEGAAGDAGDWIAGAAGDAGDWAGTAAGDIGEWTAGAAEDVGDWAGEAAGDVGDGIGDAADWAGEAAADIGDWLGDAGGDVGDFITDLF